MAGVVDNLSEEHLGINDDESDNCDEDERIPCKYGSRCYQKNPAHHVKYKHPGKRTVDDKGARVGVKKAKYSSEEDEHDEGKSSDIITLIEDEKEAIKQAFLVEMPPDFYSFWEFCKSLKSAASNSALRDAGLFPVGPFDILSGNFKKVQSCEQSKYLLHWRYYYDPPEFQTVIRGDDKQQFHMGYYRDEPTALPSFVGSNCAAVDCVITPMGENLFGAVNSYLEDFKSKIDPFRKMKIISLQKSLQSWAKKKSFDLETNTPAMRSRNKKIVAKTFHKGGIVVPINKKTDIGYRPLLEKEAQLKQILKSCVSSTNEEHKKACMDKLQPIITAANIANDECDFGTGLELGLDLFSFGGEMFHGMILHLLCTAYSMLNREEFSKIIKAHLENRKQGCDLSIIPKEKNQ